VDNSSGVLEAASSLVSRGVQALWVGGDVTVNVAIDSLLNVAKKGRIPVFTNLPPNAKRGALFDLGANYHEVGRIVGDLAGQVLRHGRRNPDHRRAHRRSRGPGAGRCGRATRPDHATTPPYNGSTTREVAFAVTKALPPVPRGAATVRGTVAVGSTVRCVGTFGRGLGHLPLAA